MFKFDSDIHHGGCVPVSTGTAPVPPSDWLPDHVFVEHMPPPGLDRRAVTLARLGFIRVNFNLKLGDGTDPCRAASATSESPTR